MIPQFVICACVALSMYTHHLIYDKLLPGNYGRVSNINASGIYVRASIPRIKTLAAVHYNDYNLYCDVPAETDIELGDKVYVSKYNDIYLYGCDVPLTHIKYYRVYAFIHKVCMVVLLLVAILIILIGIFVGIYVHNARNMDGIDDENN